MEGYGTEKLHVYQVLDSQTTFVSGSIHRWFGCLGFVDYKNSEYH